MPWRPKVPSPTWRTFLRNHLPDIAAIDMFVVATATFRLLYALIVLSLDRRCVVHFEVTQNLTQVWLSGQITEAFPWDTAPPYLLRDRDKSYGPAFRDRVRPMGITEVITAPRSPWQNPYAECLIGSIRRECLVTLSSSMSVTCVAYFPVLLFEHMAGPVACHSNGYRAYCRSTHWPSFAEPRKRPRPA